MAEQATTSTTGTAYWHHFSHNKATSWSCSDCQGLTLGFTTPQPLQKKLLLPGTILNLTFPCESH